MDPTETLRAELQQDLNDQPLTREQLEQQHGTVYSTTELQEAFVVRSFLAPFVLVERLADGRAGTLMFQHHPRFYFKFELA